jgi:hypothetical protein
MQSKKFSLYYLFSLLFIAVLMIIFAFVFQGSSSSQDIFSPAILLIAIIISPFFLAWLLLSILSWIIAHFIKTEKGIKILNWILIILPFVLLLILKILSILKS